MNLFDHRIHRLPKVGNGPGLHRVQAALDAAGLSEYLRGTPVIAVGGSNGKGSTAKAAAEVLRRCGRTTGLFTSPHLFRFNERFEVAGVSLPDQELRAVSDIVQDVIDDYERGSPEDCFGAFEAFFVMAVAAFARAGVDALVLEAGIGGRLDPVRMARAPLTAITSVDYDHMEVLGSTLAAIALDKLELTAVGGTSILGPSLASLQAQLRLQADLLRIVTLPFDAVADLVVSTADAEGSTFSLRTDGLRIGGVRLNLPGRFQPTNFAIAAALAKRLLESDGQYSSAQFVTAVRDAAAELSWAGRLQRISDDPVVTIDVGHSPGAIDAALQSYLGFASAERSLLVVGCSHNKDVVGMVTALAPHFGHIICTRAHHKGAAVDAVARHAQRANPAAVIETADPIEKAAWLAVERARAQERPVYVAGGLFLSIEFAQALSGGDPTSLRFF